MEWVILLRMRPIADDGIATTGPVPVSPSMPTPFYSPGIGSDCTKQPTHWQLRSKRLELPSCGSTRKRPLVMGIVNVTPDSFSDGGRYADIQAAVAHGLSLVAEGADILDIGGESTRPFSAALAFDEEWSRVSSVVRQLVEQSGVPVSIDTSKAIVAARAVELGVEIINDVTGLTGDADMLRVALDSGAGVCAMHMQGTPQTMQVAPAYGDVVSEVYAYLAERRDQMIASGIEHEKICLDPGIGFGKTHAHNHELMTHASRFLDLGVPILIGHSRKGYIGKIIELTGGRKATQGDLDGGTVGVACSLAAQGIQIVRVHAVGLVTSALELFCTHDRR